MSFDENAPRTVRDMIEPAIKKAGGWVNTHAHADRAFTLSPEILEMRRTHSLQQKWDALDRLKSESTEEDFYRRFSMFFELMIEQGCTACATFVDMIRRLKIAPSRPAFALVSTTPIRSR